MHHHSGYCCSHLVYQQFFGTPTGLSETQEPTPASSCSALTHYAVTYKHTLNSLFSTAVCGRDLSNSGVALDKLPTASCHPKHCICDQLQHHSELLIPTQSASNELWFGIRVGHILYKSDNSTTWQYKSTYSDVSGNSSNSYDTQTECRKHQDDHAELILASTDNTKLIITSTDHTKSDHMELVPASTVHTELAPASTGHTELTKPPTDHTELITASPDFKWYHHHLIVHSQKYYINWCTDWNTKVGVGL